MDYRQKGQRGVYFDSLYRASLEYKIHPGLVYLYIPQLVRKFNWGTEETLWFCVINGHTQNPITSFRIFEQQPTIPTTDSEWSRLQDWFNEEWSNLSFDTDRRKQKKDTIQGLKSYAKLVGDETQEKLWKGKSYEECWLTANSIHSFGRLSTFSYLEYVKIVGHAPDCNDLMFRDFEGSKSHRNGMFLLLGKDELVYDKRMENGQSGKYDNFSTLCEGLETTATEWLFDFRERVFDHEDIGRFTFESCLCQFKNNFFARRYPGVYSDMGFDRIKWYEVRGFQKETLAFREMREELLPAWLLEEREDPVVPRKIKAAMFTETGVPFRAQYLNL
jgi:hypothetical protein